MRATAAADRATPARADRATPAGAGLRAALPEGADLLGALEAGALRAARPDPAAAGGWRVDPAVKAAILRCFGDRTAVETVAGPLRLDRKSTRLNSSHVRLSRMPSSA